MVIAVKHPRLIIPVLTIAFFVVALILPPPTSGRAAELTATPTAAPIFVDGQSIPFDAYNIEGNNYLKLRDLAYALNGGPKSFDISFDSETQAILLTANHPYNPAGGEMAAPNSGSVAPQPTEAKIFLNGQEILLAAYDIEDNTYFKLRDIAQALDFAVEWGGRSGSVIIDTGTGYGQAIPQERLPVTARKLGGQELGTAPNEAVLGAPRRILGEGAATQVRVYGDYSRFTLLCVSEGKVVYTYINYYIQEQQADKLLTDSIGDDKVYAATNGNIPALDSQTTGQVLFEITNAFRGFHGLSALRWNDTLAQVARQHSQDMAQRNFFGHQNPDGAAADTRLKQAGYKYTACAENIVAGHENAFRTLNALVNSETHRYNLLTPNCDETGVGWIQSGQSKYGDYGTQVFGSL